MNDVKRNDEWNRADTIGTALVAIIILIAATVESLGDLLCA